MLAMQKIDPYGETGDKSAEKPGGKMETTDETTTKEGGALLENNTLVVAIGENNLDVPIFSEEFLNFNRSK